MAHRRLARQPLPVGKDANMFAQRSALIEQIAAQLRLLLEQGFERVANSRTRCVHRFRRRPCAQPGCEVHFGHAVGPRQVGAILGWRAVFLQLCVFYFGMKAAEFLFADLFYPVIHGVIRQPERFQQASGELQARLGSVRNNLYRAKP